MVQTILGLLNAQEGRRIGVLEQQHVSEQFQRAVGHLLGIEGVRERAVTEAEEQAPVLSPYRVNALDFWYLRGDPIEDALESRRVLPFNELDVVPKVVPVHIEMPLGPARGRLRAASGVK